MGSHVTPDVGRLGYWSGLSTTIFSLIYIVGQLAEWLDFFGSGGGPENPSTGLGLIVLLVPSLLLAPSFALLMLSVHYSASDDKKVWSHAAVMFATIYVVMVSINYYVQLTLVVPHMHQGEIESVRPFLFKPFDSFLYSVDVLGYSFMSLSTLFGAFVFTGTGFSKRIHYFMIANGCLLPFLALQIYYHPLIWPATLWAFTFPGFTISLTHFFRHRLYAAGIG